ncbi:unnamed protein product [Paramecium pentaurelia]|uniref:Uncharacterized protein n=1 Tax=Paramecium pentaurelia TaxID=43138 RepID=A0A8S1WV67_9CILI|nr:unnamed protein product [Paramecium pentaurelia]CAD8193685.1 unnamed protein product [Paramecium pentaurelia]
MPAMLLCTTIEEFYLINKETLKMHYKTIGRLLHQIQIMLMSIQSEEFYFQYKEKIKSTARLQRDHQIESK